MQHCLCIGEIGNQETQQYIQSLAFKVHFIQSLSHSSQHQQHTHHHIQHKSNDLQNIRIGDFQITVVDNSIITPHNDIDELLSLSQQYGSDIVITNSWNSNESYCYEIEGKMLISSGSITGAYHTPNHSHVTTNEGTQQSSAATASFLLMAIKGGKCIIYIYELIDGSVNVSKTHFAKQ
jgi:vacuolar protein sorting-associated protein 29